MNGGTIRGMSIQEPPHTPDDTKPTQPLSPTPAERTPPLHVPYMRPQAVDPDRTPPRGHRRVSQADFKRQAPTTLYDQVEYYGDEPQRGCGSPLLVLVTILGSVGLSLSIIVLSGLVGYQDGAKIAGTRRAETLFEAINVQRTNIAQDLASENYVLALERCYYLATLIPNDPQANQCILNQISAATVTAPPIPPLPSNPPPSNATLAPTLTPSKPATTTPLPATRSPLEILLAQAQTEFAKSTVEGYDAARESLEAIRAVDPRFQQRTVEPLLCRSYEALGGYYEQNRRLSEMVLVMDKALKINCSLKRTDWGFTINAAQLYLSAKGYLDAGNLPQAVRVYRELMRIAPTFQNTKTLACEAFRLGGDTAAISQYGC